ncbi:MAG: SDR family NAD(P)-dependent oxidoreductase [Hyphomicrobiales bacterium]
MRLSGKVAIVTGAAGNIGAAVTRLFVKEGAKLALVDRNGKAVDELAREFGPERVFAIKADVIRSDEVERYAVEALRRFGRIDAFFNNAGIEGPIEHLDAYPEEGFEMVMAVNTTGVYLGMKYVLPRMQDGGSVIITSSVMGLRGSARAVGYAASKHAVVGIMRSAAKDVAKRRIRVNTVHPGMVDSDMLRRIEAQMAARHGFNDPTQHYTATIPFGCYVTPHQIAQTVLFLASDESEQITGQTIAIDGGYLL